MPQGGHRPGSGRPRGAKDRMSQEARIKAAEGGVTPLEYMLQVMRDARTVASRRDDMAKAAAPYMHSRRAILHHSGPAGGPIQTLAIDPGKLKSMNDNELSALESAIGKLSRGPGIGEGGTSLAGNEAAFASTLDDDERELAS